MRLSTFRRVSGASAIAVLLALGPTTTYADEPAVIHLDVGFAGSMATDNQYTTQGDEVMRGGLSVHHGATVEEAADGLEKHLKVDGGNQRLEFAAASFGAAEGQARTGFKAEMRFTPRDNQQELGTVFSYGGNLFVRYQGGQLKYGFSSHANGQWQDHAQSAALPRAGQEHILQLAYLPQDNGATLQVRLDGQELPAVTANAWAHNSQGNANKFAFGGEINADASNRGLRGEYARIRVTDPGADFVLTPSTPPGENPGNPDCEFEPFTPANFVPVTSADCPQKILAAASAARPNDKQVRFHEAGLTAFLHFGINTFYGQEWGHGTEDPARFNPSQLDTDQWARTLAAQGFRYAILTVKHHDGFMLYNSRYTDFDVASSPWRDGQGDVVRDFVNSAHRYGLKVGIYLSPADSSMERKGIFGNGSERTARQIPTLVENDDRAARVASGDLPSFTYQATDYGTLFLNTLYELLTEYGPIDEVWFDGAAGNTAGTERFDYDAFYDLIGKLQPNAAVAVAGRDVRWVGNEGGLAREAEWNPQAVHEAVPGGRIYPKPSDTARDLGSSQSIIGAVQSGTANYLHWWPAEADTSIRGGWFWHASQGPKSLATLQGVYNRSVGRNSILLLNVPPDRAGRIDGRDVARLLQLRRWVRQSMPYDLAVGRPGAVGTTQATVAAPELTDGNRYTAPAPVQLPAVFEVDLGETTEISRIGLGEEIKGGGQQVEAYTVEALTESGWVEVSTGPTIGYKRLDVLTEPVQASKVRLTVTAARGPVHISALEVFRADAEFEVPTDYYLDVTAPQAGTGLSEQSPFNTVEQLKAVTFLPGTTLHVKRGTTVGGDLVLWGYGSQSRPAKIAFYGTGADPVVQTGADTTVTWEQYLEANALRARGFVVGDQAPAVTDGDDPALEEVAPPSYPNTINPRTISVQASSEETQREDGRASNVLDGDGETIWHSRWSGAPIGTPPNELIFDLGKEYDLTALRYTARSQSDALNSKIKNYEIYVSAEAGQRGKLVASGEFTESADEQRVTFAAARGRYVTLRAVSSQSTRNGSFSSAAEVRLEGTAGGGQATPTPTPTPTVTPTPTPTAAPLATERTAGRNRVETALAVASSLPGNWPTVVLASGTNHADALAATPLAATLDAPMLLTTGEKLEPALRQALMDKQVQRVYLIGGTGSVPEAKVQELRQLGMQVERVAGRNRFATATAVAETMVAAGMPIERVLVADGLNHADALAAGAVAAAADAVVVLTDARGVPAETRQFLAKHQTDVVAVGGHADRALRQAGLSSTKTIVGSNRYETAAKLADEFLPRTEVVVLASGETYPDALAGGTLAARLQARLLLTAGNQLSAPTAELLRRSPEVGKVILVGGEGSLSAQVTEALRQLRN
ncbi:hypothetical protein EII12_06805 [Buchananella hordeovulneris]|uniref:cell wall-binding repeat-containing protein n=1 Tax=Buchananella hordeovulneris TaxID=52770 RepID=UPI000F5EABB5|nr:cell wall-binding repeat-containing protein [Buchananella hordeovulneris]RRD51899.1 hypothetical protein EII12_06805 [Buchananella hordeovulneris]